MTTPKTILCRCEDITADEVVKAIRGGYPTFEDVKRFLGVGTGPCQGKSCVQATVHQIAAHRGIPVDQVDVMTYRPPVRPVPFATLAAADGAFDQDVPTPFAVPPPRLMPVDEARPDPPAFGRDPSTIGVVSPTGVAPPPTYGPPAHAGPPATSPASSHPATPAWNARQPPNPGGSQ